MISTATEARSELLRVLPRLARPLATSLVVLLVLWSSLSAPLWAQSPTQGTGDETVQEAVKAAQPESPTRAGLSTGVAEQAPVSATAPRIHNPGLFNKSARAAAATIQQYGTTDRPLPGSKRRDRGDDAAGREQRESELERVQRIGYRLALASEFDKYPFTFGVVDMPIPNAFALPAGQVFITRGMLELGLTDDQLAALLGHEIAHVTQEHFIKMRRRATLLNSLATLVTIGAIATSGSSRDDYYRGPGGLIVNDSSSADVAQAAMTTGAVVSELLLRNYSRDNEDESDDHGQKLAALAGFDPDGARQLMAKMNLRIPQDKSFGYWQTHPFFDERVIAAEARGKSLVARTPAPEGLVDSYRHSTQDVLLNFTEAATEKELEPPVQDMIRTSALRAWPRGPRADQIRVTRLHTLREGELAKLQQSRDYGRVLTAYLDTLEEIRKFSPESPTLAVLSQEIGELREQKQELLPEAVRILEGGIYQTQFLESYLSNFPESTRSPEAALQLGLAYSRLHREGDAVERFLEVLEKDPDGAFGQQAARGLRNLAPLLTRLTALEQLAQQDRDPTVTDLALRRLQEQARAYDDLANGAEYLERYPDGLFADTVSARLEKLAENLYREMRLYEEVGDSAKAIARANLILENAPLSAAAQRLSRELADEEIDDPRNIG